MGAKQGERCGHCGTSMQAGYATCSGCGATRKELRPALGWLAAGVVGVVLYGILDTLLGAMSLPVAIGAGIVVLRCFPKKATYLRVEAG